MKLTSLATLEVVKMTTSSAASDKNFRQNYAITIAVYDYNRPLPHHNK